MVDRHLNFFQMFHRVGSADMSNLRGIGNDDMEGRQKWSLI